MKDQFAELGHKLDAALADQDDEAIPVTAGESGSKSGIWAESTEHGVVIYALVTNEDGSQIKVAFGCTRAQARHVAGHILRAAGADN